MVLHPIKLPNRIHVTVPVCHGTFHFAPHTSLCFLEGHPKVISIGRSRQSDFVIPCDGISNRHCVIIWEADRLFVEDDSTNGTYINGQRISKNTRVSLSTHDMLSLYKHRAAHIDGEGDSIFVRVNVFNVHVSCVCVCSDMGVVFLIESYDSMGKREMPDKRKILDLEARVTELERLLAGL